MAHMVDTSQLRSALEALETSLETPRVPGELEPWLAGVRMTIEKVAPLLTRELDRDHKTLLAQIAAEDPELHARVARLKCGEEETRAQLARLQEWITRLAEKTPYVEPDEGRLEQEIVKFVEQGLAFVIHVRKQEIAIDTWLHEALYRDGGVGD